MKKPCLLPVALAVCGFFALSVGCTNDFDMIMSGNSSSDDEPIQISAPYAESDLQTLLFTDTAKSVTVDVSANTYLKELLLSLSYYETATPAPTETIRESLAASPFTSYVARVEFVMSAEMSFFT